MIRVSYIQFDGSEKTFVAEGYLLYQGRQFQPTELEVGGRAYTLRLRSWDNYILRMALKGETIGLLQGMQYARSIIIDTEEGRLMIDSESIMFARPQIETSQVGDSNIFEATVTLAANYTETLNQDYTGTIGTTATIPVLGFWKVYEYVRQEIDSDVTVKEYAQENVYYQVIAFEEETDGMLWDVVSADTLTIKDSSGNTVLSDAPFVVDMQKLENLNVAIFKIYENKIVQN